MTSTARPSPPTTRPGPMIGPGRVVGGEGRAPIDALSTQTQSKPAPTYLDPDHDDGVTPPKKEFLQANADGNGVAQADGAPGAGAASCINGKTLDS